MTKYNALVLKADGTNCELETQNVLRMTGFNADIVLFKGLTDNVKLTDYSFIVIPGGFSYGDYTGSGRICASIIKHHMIDEFKAFIDKGGLILGICNGFQIMVKSGILPNIHNDFSQNVSLIFNDSHHYEDRWVRLKIRNNSVFTRNINEILELPIAHAEGKFIYGDNMDIENHICMQYIDSNGTADPGYPINPNGAMDNIAAITDKTGRIMGMMPHPERFYTDKLHYDRNQASINGKVLFDNAYRYIKEEL